MEGRRARRAFADEDADRLDVRERRPVAAAGGPREVGGGVREVPCGGEDPYLRHLLLEQALVGEPTALRLEARVDVARVLDGLSGAEAVEVGVVGVARDAHLLVDALHRGERLVHRADAQQGRATAALRPAADGLQIVRAAWVVHARAVRVAPNGDALATEVDVARLPVEVPKQRDELGEPLPQEVEARRARRRVVHVGDVPRDGHGLGIRLGPPAHHVGQDLAPRLGVAPVGDVPEGALGHGDRGGRVRQSGLGVAQGGGRGARVQGVGEQGVSPEPARRLALLGVGEAVGVLAHVLRERLGEVCLEARLHLRAHARHGDVGELFAHADRAVADELPGDGVALLEHGRAEVHVQGADRRVRAAAPNRLHQQHDACLGAVGVERLPQAIVLWEGPRGAEVWQPFDHGGDRLLGQLERGGADRVARVRGCERVVLRVEVDESLLHGRVPWVRGRRCAKRAPRAAVLALVGKIRGLAQRAHA